ncbi:MAG: c-type cytochrome [Polyangiales bacterium]
MTARLGEVVEQPTAPPPIAGGTLLALRDGRTFVAADPDRDRLWITDTSTGAVRAVALSPGDEPGRAAEGEGVVYVALRRGGAVVTLDVGRGEITARRAVCPAPRGLAWDDTRRELIVACAGGELTSIPAEGAPRVAQLDDDLRDVVLWNGRRFVTRFRSAQLLEVGLEGEVLWRGGPPLFRDANGNSRSPGVAWRTVSHPTLGLVMLHQLSSLAPITLTDARDAGVRSGGAYGGGAGGDTCTPGMVSSVITTFRGQELLAANMHLPGAILAVDLAVHAQTFALVTPGNNIEHVVGMSFGVSSSQRVACISARRLTSAGPTVQSVAVAFTQDGQVVHQRRDEAGLEILGSTRRFLPFPDAPSVRDTGHAVFHAGTPAGMACASCHPEGGDDGRVWTFTGIGPRRTPPLRGATSDTAPFHWDGDMTNLSHLLGDVLAQRMSAGLLTSAQQSALSHWIDGLPVLHLKTPADAETLARGRAVFEGPAGCADCHAGAALTNNDTVDVGTGGRFQVPQLRGLAARAPYLHDGRALTLDHRLMLNDGDRHGRTSTLTAEQRADLVRYLESL